MVVVAVVMGLGAAGQARAQGNEDSARAAARKLGYAGVEAYQAGDFAVASQKLEKAYAVVRVPSLGLWSARALAKRGKLVAAAERFFEVTRLPLTGGDADVQKRAQADAQTELDALQPTIPSVVIVVKGAAPSAVHLSLDGAPMPSELVKEATPIDPGSHHLEGVLDGRTVTKDFELKVQEQKRVVLSFKAEAEPEPSAAAAPASTTSAADTSVATSSGNTRRTLGWVTLSVGAAGLVFGGVTGVLTLTKRSALDEGGCKSPDNCPARLSGDIDSYNSMRTLSTVGFVAGGVLAAAGAVLLFTTPRTPQTALLVSPSAVALRRSF